MLSPLSALAPLGFVVLLGAGLPSAATLAWQPLADGVEYTTVTLTVTPEVGDGVLHVVRVAPEQAAMRVLAASAGDGKPRTAAQWQQDYDALVVVNAGMFEADHRTHTGYLRTGDHVNNDAWVANYRSLLLLGASRPGLPAGQILDVEPKSLPQLVADYRTVVQNLRLIRDRGRGTWQKNPRRWSEAALAQDAKGRFLVLFSRTPWSMAEFNAKLLSLPLGVKRAMHLEGGPEASLSVRGPGVNLDLAGSFETGFNDNDNNETQWPLPFVLAVGGTPAPNR